jgi:catenin alpha
LRFKITTLATGNMSNRKKGRSKRAHVLVQELIEATNHFLKQGNEIAQENPDMKDELAKALNDVKLCGDMMAGASKDFADDPFSSQKRANMVAAARELLNAVARLLAIADMIDIRLLFKVINLVSTKTRQFQVGNLNRFFFFNFHYLSGSA